MKRLGFLMVLGLGNWLAGCSNSDFQPLPADVCAEQHSETTGDGYDVVVCDELYPTAPFVHLPAANEGHAYAGIQGMQFVTADGASHGGGDIQSEDKRHAVALYDLALEANSVVDFQPVLLFSDALFLETFVGQSFEGTISSGAGEGSWVFDPSLPVRVTVRADKPAPGAGGSYEVRAVIDNLNEALTASDGSCMPALSSYGDEAPFASDVEPDMRLSRVASMHNFGDDHFVIEWSDGASLRGSLMGPAWYRGPIDVVRGTLDPSETYEGRGHGSPGSIPNLDLDRASGGGEPCTP